MGPDLSLNGGRRSRFLQDPCRGDLHYLSARYPTPLPTTRLHAVPDKGSPAADTAIILSMILARIPSASMIVKLKERPDARKFRLSSKDDSRWGWNRRRLYGEDQRRPVAGANIVPTTL